VIKIGVSPRLLHPQPGARGVHTKILHYVEDGIARWLQSRKALLFVLPLSERAADYAQALDGLVLQGGADISPLAYGEEPLKPEWAGDPVRDRYEIELVRAFTEAGKPVLGTITYHAFADNPHLKDVSGLDQPGYFADAGGSFAVTGLPGPGILEVLADEDDYLKVQPAADWKLVPGINTAPPVAHAYVRIDPSEKNPQSATFDIALEAAAAVKASVVGVDGKPCGAYFVAGLTASPRNNSSWLMPHESPTFTVRGLDARQQRTVVVYSAEKKLGKAQVVRGDEAGAIAVRLQPLSSLTGRVLDADGRPWAGVHVEAMLDGKGDNGARLPVQLFITTGTWAAHLEGKATTDADGKFRLDGLLPGLKYTLLASEGGSADPDRLIVKRDGVSPPAAGHNEDLGDLRRQKSR